MTFHELYTTYYSRSYRFVKSYVRDSAAAEDIVSESMIALWSKMDDSRSDTLLPFLYTILRNRSLDYLKSHRVAKGKSCFGDEWEIGDMDLLIATLNDSTQDKIFSDEIGRIVNEALAELPQKTREIFKLSRMEGKTYLEIADILGMTDKGVEYHMGTALKLLRTALKDYLPSSAIFV